MRLAHGLISRSCGALSATFDAVLDQAVTTLGNFLLLLFSLRELCWVADSNSAGKPVCQFDFVKLLFDHLTQFNIIKIA